MFAAELLIHASLLTIGVFVVAAIVSTAKEKRLHSRTEMKPPRRKKNAK